MAYVLIAFL